MERFVLNREVQVCGRDFFGRRTSVSLCPYPEPGWFWQTRNEIVPITPAVLASKWRRLVLSYQKSVLNVYEHLGVLRFSGLDNVLIIPESNWLPYDGSATIFWEAVKPHLRSSGVLRPSFAYPMEITERGKTGPKKVRYNHGGGGYLSVVVVIDYPGLGYHSYDLTLPGLNFDQVAEPKTQGWPKKMRYVAKVARCVRWPHYDSIVWPQEHASSDTLDLFARHRALDLLGALSVVCPPGGFLTGVVQSIYAGHSQDVQLARSLHVARVVDGKRAA